MSPQDPTKMPSHWAMGTIVSRVTEAGPVSMATLLTRMT